MRTFTHIMAITMHTKHTKAPNEARARHATRRTSEGLKARRPQRPGGSEGCNAGQGMLCQPWSDVLRGLHLTTANRARTATVGEPPSTEIGVLTMPPLQAKKAEETSPRKRTPRTLMEVGPQYPPV